MERINEAWDSAAAVAAVTALFERSFGAAPAGVWSAPGRVNLIGEHTDYNGGLALPIALPHRTFVALKARPDRRVRLVSAQAPQLREVDLDAVGPHDGPDRVEGWPAYVVGVAWALEQAGYSVTGFDIAVDSCVPFGAGLSSSAALECAVAVGLSDLNELAAAGDDAARSRLVQVCVSAENDIAGAPTGGMDQAASLRCREGHALGLDCRDGSVTHVPFDLAGARLALLVIDTKAPHQLNDGQYAARRAACEDAAQQLGVEYLADITDLDAALAQLTDPVQVRRVRHVVTEIARTATVIETLLDGGLGGANLGRIGAAFNASHDSLRDDYEVTCPELDLAVDTARAEGAYGARMTGGGFGGSAIALVDAPRAHAVAEAISTAFAQAGFNPPEFLIVTPAAPAGRSA